MSGSSTYTGRARQRRTRPMVRWADRIARLCIIVGGISTIAAICMVAVFLVWVAWPLFLPPELISVAAQPTQWHCGDGEHLVLDEEQSVGWSISSDGVLRLFRLDAGHVGQVVVERELSPDVEVTAVAVNNGSPDVVLGLADGTILIGRVALSRQIISPRAVPNALREMAPGQFADWQHGLMERTAQGVYRLYQIDATFDEPVAVAESPVRLIDQTLKSRGQVLAVYCDDGRVRVLSVSRRQDLLTNEVIVSSVQGELPEAYDERPIGLLVAGSGDNVFVVGRNGRFQRYEIRNVNEPRLLEESDLVPEEGESVTAVSMLVGKRTLVVGDSLGRVRAWFGIRPTDASTPDGQVFVAAHEMLGSGAAVVGLSPAARSRVLAAAYADGLVRLFYTTTEQSILAVRLSPGERPGSIALAPQANGLLTGTGSGLVHWRMDIHHPEVSFTSLFGRVWYEGANEPAFVWQSTGGTDDFEPKMGLVPLIFGTLKAAFYSLAFGVPLALLAAIYTSEFLSPRTKATIKPTIELMASLPSVVLGFLAAQVFAPFIEQLVPATLASFVVLPASFLLGAYLWQLLPAGWRVVVDAWRLLFIALVVPAGVALSFAVGPWVERLLFEGSIKSWLDGQQGSAETGWFMMLIPLAGVTTFLLNRMYVAPLVRRSSLDWSRSGAALADLGIFLVNVVVCVGLTWAVSTLLGTAGLDLRGAVFGTYIQRNAMIVGFAMGFAIIPIIYTIAEDALSSVPQHLRSASLGCGATPWQTALRVVVPTAMSGLFSAIMVGMGRAVGETMIVLMAGGNTPIMDLNPFNGFRTLPANLAVELPEAVKDSTHFRVLFLSAVVLFAMTFVLNTLAEVVRQRFRRRAVQL